MGNDSIGVINYLSGGDKSASRERLEIIGDGAVGTLDNFKRCHITKGGKRRQYGSHFKTNRGHRELLDYLLNQVRPGSKVEVSTEEYINTTLTTFAIKESIRKGARVPVIMPALDQESSI